ncbi:endonuclease/exonuclease/phosphatase family protein [Gulosibacter molinativorax]|uniref:Endonuclease/exonuclease/phosphatase family protein n=1 Tax=Gulosibacter molinativorax TaxID=256821 RepID=A0ABT7C6B5_9MICO|nr:endonuclease/exonuclease/phosphatase family protein [Gulosibacter molinativorax]MDJ1370575.1 endonuclease/exonuclease/phosphatase family protein [Gulosibacter molinativorax]QUY62009.1 Putative membrane protein with hydrolase activity [Gulosibacter molinativorax]
MPSRKKISPAWAIFGTIFGLAVFIAGAVFIWPQWFGLQRELLISQAISFRLVILIGIAAALVVVLLILLTSRRIRALFAGTAIALSILLLAGGFNYLSRGISPATPATGAEEAIRVLAWNTLGNEPGSPTIAQLALDYDADVIMLPETTQDMGLEIAGLLKEQGKPMWVISNTGAPGYRAAETTLLISADLGEYQINMEYGDTSALATVIAEPVDGDGPRFVAAHPIAPTQEYMEQWRSDLEWLSTICEGNTIMGGDFNATLDHMSGLENPDAPGADFGACRDAAQDLGGASMGTWTSGRPPQFVPAIDHVMSTEQWETTGFEVIQREDRAGSDHRPVFAELTPVS